MAAIAALFFARPERLTIRKNPLDYRENYNWRPEVIEDIIKQAETGGVLLTGMGDDKESAYLLGPSGAQCQPGDQPLH